MRCEKHKPETVSNDREIAAKLTEEPGKQPRTSRQLSKEKSQKPLRLPFVALLTPNPPGRIVTWFPMKIPFVFIHALFAPLSGLNAQEGEFQNTATDGAPIQVPKQSAPIHFEILSTETKRVYVTEAAEMADLPPTQGIINVTVHRVEDPDLPDPPVSPRVSTSSHADSALTEPTALNQETAVETSLILVSATVYDHCRTLVRISPNGIPEDEISAWSNVDFNHFTGFSTFKFTDDHGIEREYALMMGIGNEEVSDTRVEQPRIPNLPELSTQGPSFSVAEGNTQGQGMKLLTQLHEFYQNKGPELEAAFQAREKAQAERKAYLLANPAVPNDVTIHFWKRDTPLSEPTQGGGR